MGVFFLFKILVSRFFWKNPSTLTACYQFSSLSIPMYLNHRFPFLNSLLCCWNSYLYISFILWCCFLKCTTSIYFFSFLKVLLIFRSRGREGGREGEKHPGWEKHGSVACHTPTAGDLACNSGMCFDWKSNLRPFSSQAGARSTEPHQPWLYYSNLNRVSEDRLTWKR